MSNNGIPAMRGTSSSDSLSFRTKRTRASVDLISDVNGELSRPFITSTFAPKARKSNDISDFTIDKLKYDSLGLHGREKEIKLLNNALNNVMSGEPPEHERQLVLISGYSGTGKTALASHALKKATEKLGGLYVRGKFDLNLRNQPYSGISAACAEICDAIVALKSRNPSLSEQICSQIITELGSELSLLVQVVPILAKVVAFEGDNANSPHVDGMSSSADAKNRINFAFLRFIRAVSFQFTPLVFVLDDLQWVDGASIDLLEALLTDPTSKTKLLMVGIYRSNEVDETHIFHHSMKHLKAKSRENYFVLNQLEIGNLEVDAVRTIIQDLLGMDDSDSSRTWGLADVCHRKTVGNAFFLLRFVEMLKERQLLQFNFGSVSWTWDEKEIEARTTSSDNVVDLLKTKMAMLSEDLVDLLKFASCLGSTFELHTLNIVWDQSSTDAGVQHDCDIFMDSVASLEALGYLVQNESESTQYQTYSWSHDKVQESALSLVPETEQGVFSAKVGQILLSHLEEKELDSAIFMVVDLLNGNLDGEMEGKPTTSRLDLAQLNCRASQKAISCSAFDSAARYAAIAIRILPENAWVDQYELTLNLFTIGAKAEGVLGNTETMERYCKQVISQADRPIEDKFGVYHTWIDSEMNRVQIDEARGLSLEILKKFNCHFPKSFALIGLGVIWNVIKIKATMKSRDVSKLSLMNDTTRIEGMRFLDKLGTIFYSTKDDRLPLVAFKALNLTMKYGYCDYSSVTFACVGLILTGALNDLSSGSKYGEQALILLERSKSQTTAARTIFCVYGFSFAYTKPIRSLLNPLLRGYDIGLQTGDTESAMYAMHAWVISKFLIGSSLESLEADSFLYIRQMKALKRDQAHLLTKSWRQLFLVLLGRDNADKPTRFSGDSFSSEELECFRDDPYVGPLLCAHRGILFTYFGEYVQYADIIIKVGHDHFQKAVVGSPNHMWDTLIKGVSCFAAARATRKKKYARMGRIFRSKMHSWLNMGNPNVKHYASLLDAEWTAFKGSKYDAIKEYESSILLAARGGYQQDAALATERLGEFYFSVMGDRDNAAYQIGQSIKYWGEWGAVAKVRHLQEKYADLLMDHLPDSNVRL